MLFKHGFLRVDKKVDIQKTVHGNIYKKNIQKNKEIK
jgi:hypothetical protein